MARFDFSTGIISEVINELESAESYIRIAVFQLHNKEVFDILVAKLKQEVKIEVFTLPIDSINDKSIEEVRPRLQELQELGATLHFCRWNVGDPGRTTTAVGRWYSFHGKFIVTDKSAICLSANLIENSELDSLIIFNETDKITQFNEQFDSLVNLFITPQNEYDGSIHEKIIAEDVDNVDAIFKLPETIEEGTHGNHWIVDYPSSLCLEDVEIEDKLYTIPFDSKGRNLIESIINESSDFVYLATESFTDLDFPMFLRSVVAKKELDFRILCGSKSMDFSDRINIMFRELLALKINIKTRDNIHAKLVITDKHLVISSINLNKINLGFSRKKGLWRENTETLLICSDSNIIESAKDQYIINFEDSIDIELKLAEKIEDYVTKMFSRTFGLRTKKEAKSLLSKHILEMELEIKRTTFKVGKIAAKMMNLYKKKTISEEDIVSALILHYLSESKLNSNQLTDKLKGLKREIDIMSLLDNLSNKGLVENEEDFYKINVENLF